MMNPETNRMESLFLKEDGLVRPDGSPVPKNWSIFKEGEKFVLNNYTFRLAHIGESYIVLEPVSQADVADSLAASSLRAKRNQRKHRAKAK